MKEKISLGIIGCGYWGPNFVRNFRRIGGVNIRYTADLNPQRLSRVKKLYPDILTTQNYLHILRDTGIEAVVIATPAHTHYKIARDSLMHGKHVLIEKPMTGDIRQAEELIALAARKGKILMVGHTFKFNPAVTKLKELINKNELGKIHYIYSRRTNLGPLNRDVSAMWDLAPHDISICNYLMGVAPKSVSADGAKYLPHNLEDVCFITLYFPGNILGHIHVSWLDPRKVREVVIVGSKKMAIFDDLDLKAPIRIYDQRVMIKGFRQDYKSFKEFRMITRDRKVAFPKIKKEEPLHCECRHFIQSIRKHAVPLTDGRDGLEVLKVLVAVQNSLNEGGSRIAVNK